MLYGGTFSHVGKSHVGGRFPTWEKAKGQASNPHRNFQPKKAERAIMAVIVIQAERKKLKSWFERAGRGFQSCFMIGEVLAGKRFMDRDRS